jgi:hypothetical protein
MAKRKNISAKNKAIIQARAQNCCEYCQSPSDFSTELFSIEHILPLSLGGSDDMNNLVFACIGCNVFKSNKIQGVDPVTKSMHPLFSPRTMVWNEHFLWDTNFVTLIALSAIARTTIEELKLNRQPLKNLRRALVAIGVHPLV